MAAKLKKVVIRNPETQRYEERSVIAGQGENLMASDPAKWFDLFVDGVDGQPVANITREQAYRFATYQACLRIRSQSLSQLDMRVYRKVGRNTEEQTAHPVNELLKFRPNTEQTPVVFKRFGARIADSHGNFYAWIDRDGPRVKQIVPLAPGISSVRRENGVMYYATTIEIDGRQRLVKIKPEDVIHVFYHPDDTGIMGREPFIDLKSILAQGISGRDFISKLMQKGGNIGGWLEHPDDFKDSATATRFREQWDSHYSGMSNAGKVAILRDGMKYHQLKPMSGTDAQTLENMKKARDDIIGYYQIPPHMISVLDKANYNNLGSLDSFFIKHTLMPMTTVWSQEFTYKLLSESERRDGVYIGFDYSMLRQGDVEQELELTRAALIDGWMDRNEARERHGLEVSDPRLDEPVLPVNLAPLSTHERVLGNNGESTAPANDEPEEDQRSIIRPAVRALMNKHIKAYGVSVRKIANSESKLSDEETAKQCGETLTKRCASLEYELEPLAMGCADGELTVRAIAELRTTLADELKGENLNDEANALIEFDVTDEQVNKVIYEQS